MRVALLALVLQLSWFGSSCGTPQPLEGSLPVVMTLSGRVSGVPADGGTWAYLGIPYAEAPTGERRFAPPVPKAAWAETLVADAFGPPCPQRRGNGGVIGEEDCLRLNLWVPRRSPGPLPVIVFLHGGENMEGSSSDYSDDAYLYDGTFLASQGPAVVVTLNYRLGALGFMAHPDFGARSFALLDQLLALQWVSDNIAAFGGDAARVLAVGQSAGANDVCTLLASRMARGRFSRAMLLSSSGDCWAVTRRAAEREGVRLARELGCPDTGAGDCLRNHLSVESLVRSSFDDALAAAAVDGELLTGRPREVFLDGGHNSMPVVVSSTAEEFNSLPTTPVASEAELRSELSRRYPGWVDAILAEYPPSQFSSANQAWLSLLTDDWFTCSARAISRALSDHQREPVRRAFFHQTFERGPYRIYGSGHGIDLFFWWHNFGSVPSSDAEERLSRLMVSYLARFAATGDPNGGNDPLWPRYDSAADTSLELSATSTGPRSAVRGRTCALWDAYYGR